MSHHKHNLILSKQAAQDLEDILLYSLQEWGEQQMYSYQAALSKALSTIQQNPFIGYRHIQLSNQHRLFQVKQHILIYKVVDSTIFVSRVLHRRMDITRHL